MVATRLIDGKAHAARIRAALADAAKSLKADHGTVPGLATVSYTYESSGRLKRAQQGSETTEYSYFADGLVHQIIEPLWRLLFVQCVLRNKGAQLK